MVITLPPTPPLRQSMKESKESGKSSRNVRSVIDPKEGGTTVMKEAFPLFHLPNELIARVLVFLPSGQVAKMRRLCFVLAKAGKIAMVINLMEAGVRGEDFVSLTTHARDFIDQNQRVWGVLADQRCLAWNRHQKNCHRRRLQDYYHNHHVDERCYDWVEVPFLPRLTDDATAVKKKKRNDDDEFDFIHCPNLASKFALRRRTTDGELVVIGIKLSNVPLRARVPVKQYLDELEYQRNSCSRGGGLFPPDSYRELMEFLRKKIEEMRWMHSRGTQFAFVSYIPKLQRRPPMRLNNNRHKVMSTTYDTFVAETTKPLSSRSLIAAGVGRGNDCVVGTNLDGLQLAFRVPISEINSLYDRGVENVTSHTARNLERLQML